MIKKYINKSTVFTIIIILLLAYFLNLWLSRNNPPTIVVKYNGKNIETSIGCHSWIGKNGGSTYETGGDYTLGLKTPKFTAEPCDNISILIPKNPNKVLIHPVIDDIYTNYISNERTLSKNGNEYNFALTTAKGEYVFEVFASWDIAHNMAAILRVEVK